MKIQQPYWISNTCNTGSNIYNTKSDGCLTLTSLSKEYIYVSVQINNSETANNKMVGHQFY